MRKLNLRVNRLILIKYGPYTLEMVPILNNMVEVSVRRELRKILYRYYKSRTDEATKTLIKALNEKVSSDDISEREISA